MRTSGRREEAGFGAGEKVSQGREPPGGNISMRKLVDAPEGICTGSPQIAWV